MLSGKAKEKYELLQEYLRYVMLSNDLQFVQKFYKDNVKGYNQDGIHKNKES